MKLPPTPFAIDCFENVPSTIHMTIGLEDDFIFLPVVELSL